MSEIKELIKNRALQLGADLVGFSNLERYDETESHNNPSCIFPEAKSLIGLGFRVLRGSTRGIEEGSVYYQYITMGIENIEENVIPVTLLRLSSFIENMGYEAVPQKYHRNIMFEEEETNPEIIHDHVYRGIKHESQIDFRRAAVTCGFGEIGMGGRVLTKEFGPYQRFCFILTNAEIEPDIIPEPSICDRCGKCMAACPGNAYIEDECSQTIGEYNFRFHEVDSWQCAVYYKGANKSTNPFMPPDAYSDLPEREKILSGSIKVSPESAVKILERTNFYPGCRHSMVSSICGRACDRACYIHLEENDKISKKFHSKYRKRKQWKLED